MATSPLISPFSASVPPPASEPRPRGFVELDDRLTSLAPGVVVARAAEGGVQAIVAHAVRRIRGGGAAAIQARAREAAPMWQEVAARLGLAAASKEPAQFAEQVLDAAASQRVAIVAPVPASGTWDRAVTCEVGRLAQNVLVVLVGDDVAQDLPNEAYEVTQRLDHEARRRWWAAIAEDGSASATDLELAELEQWWAARRRAPEESPHEVPAAGRALFTALALAGLPWPEACLAALPGAEGLHALARAGAVNVEGGWVAIEPAWEDVARDAAKRASRDERAALAEALLLARGDDPWAVARAALLLLGAGSAEAADAAFARATARIDALARRELLSRWMDAVDGLAPEVQFMLRRNAAVRALEIGEADEALRWAQTATSLVTAGSAGAVELTLLVGRAAASAGDLVTARVALERGRANALDAEADAAFAVELAEVHYLTGDLAGAASEATAAFEAAKDFRTKLGARNTLGKLLLATAKWDDAERHFAEDAHAAATSGERTAELRARLNRGIALLSKGLGEQARVIFDAVLAEGERAGDWRACAFALDNLAVVHFWRRDYGAALEASERTARIRQNRSDRVSMARVLTNLAELRRTVGLLEHAEHTILFARRAIGPGMVIKGLSVGVIAARIALERGNAVLARREITKAIVDCEAAGDQSSLAQAYCVATRIALEDGNVPEAADALAKARETAVIDEVRAEIALLAALHARAEGLPHAGTRRLAEDAVVASRKYGREDFERDAHVLLCEIDRAAGEAASARAHLEHAIILRDRMAETLSPEIRREFLTHPGLANLVRLQTVLAESSPVLGDGDDEAPHTQRAGSVRPPATSPREPREIVGEDPAVRGLLAAIKKVARSNATVLIRGESGTGKELVAEALHRASDRAAGPLVTVNCAALVETLLLSELFGHEKGAFTGAFARRRGRFELAEGGTLFLDEIGDISPRTQVALLRVLQERTFERVGGTTAIRANVRIVCATHRDLKAMVDRGEFREDLYYRLRGITLEVPALRQRMGDLPRISDALLQRIAQERGEAPKGLSQEAIDLLGRHRWPGNVRELENALRAASLFAEGAQITASDLADNVDDLRAMGVAPTSLRVLPRIGFDGEPPRASTGEVDAGADEDSAGALPVDEANATAVAYAQVRVGSVSLGDMKRQIERDCIARALAETRGNITRAAALLGMKRPRLSQLVKQYGLAAVSSEDR